MSDNNKSLNNNSASSLKVELEITIAANIESVWIALTEQVNSWWSKDYFASAADSINLEPRLGGRLFEDLGNGQGLTWYHVQAIEAPKLLCLSGYVFPNFGGPTLSLLQIDLEQKDDKTLVKICDGIIGHISEKTQSNVRGGWEDLFNKGLKGFVESS